MTPRRPPPKPASYYEKIVKELEEVARMVQERPELNHDAAARLKKIAKDIRADAGLAPAKPKKS